MERIANEGVVSVSILRGELRQLDSGIGDFDVINRCCLQRQQLWFAEATGGSDLEENNALIVCALARVHSLDASRITNVLCAGDSGLRFMNVTESGICP